jgi:hypothetical protein
VTKPMLNIKSFCAAGSLLAGIELIHMIRKGQFVLTALRPSRSRTNFLRWQEWSVKLERLRPGWGGIPLFDQQRNRTILQLTQSIGC